MGSRPTKQLAIFSQHMGNQGPLYLSNDQPSRPPPPPPAAGQSAADPGSVQCSLRWSCGDGATWLIRADIYTTNVRFAQEIRRTSLNKKKKTFFWFSDDDRKRRRRKNSVLFSYSEVWRAFQLPVRKRCPIKLISMRYKYFYILCSASKLKPVI